MAFSENLQFIRTQAAITQEQLAEQLGVSRQSVSKWESGASFPEMDTLLKLCDLYDVDLDTLLRGSVEASRVSDTARYDDFMNRFSRRMADSVSAILCGVALMIFLNAIGVPEMLSVAAFMMILTISVVIIVASAIQHDNFCKKHPYVQDFYSEEEKDAFHQKFVWYIAGGVGAILFGVVLLFLFFTLLPEKEPYESFASSVLLLLIAGATYAFVYAGIQDEKYKVWKYNRDNAPAPEAKAQLQKISTACGVIMLLATAIYVWSGFVQNLWDTAWWVFVVGGILCGVVSVIWDPYKGED